MCTPLTALSAASSISGYLGQKSAAKQQEQAQARASISERQRVGAESSNIRLRQGQQRVALANEMEEGARRANVARATAAVSAGESGVGGRAAELLNQDINVQAARYNHQLQNQRSENDFAADLQNENAIIRSQQNQIRINQPIQKPNPLALIGSLVGGIAQAQTFETNYETKTGNKMGFGNLFGLNIGGSGESDVAPSQSSQPLPQISQTFNSAPVQESSRVYSDIGLPQGSSPATGSLLPPIS